MIVRHRFVPVLLFAAALLGCRGSGTPKSSASASQVAAQPALPPGLPAGEVQSSGDPRAAIFLAKGCPQCHSISGLGVKSPNEIGPDLTVAYGDVRNRFNTTLENFLPNPTGTMQMVLGQLIKLTPVERDSIIHILKRLHDAQDEHGDHSR